METESDTPNETGQAPETELGARLTRARDEQELSLEKAAASLKVDVAVLNNLETENFDALGAPVFVRGCSLLIQRPCQFVAARHRWARATLLGRWWCPSDPLEK